VISVAVQAVSNCWGGKGVKTGCNTQCAGMYLSSAPELSISLKIKAPVLYKEP
jgi:hypothetical protein